MFNVSHTIEDDAVTYPDLLVPILCDYLSRETSRDHYAEESRFQTRRIDMVANTGICYLAGPNLLGPRLTIGRCQ